MKTVKQEYKRLKMSHLGDLVNEFMSKHGVKTVVIGSKKMKVTKPRGKK